MFIKFWIARRLPAQKVRPSGEEKGKRKRIIKASTANSTEEAEVVESAEGAPDPDVSDTAASNTGEKKVIKKAGASQTARKEEKHLTKEGS